MVPADSSQAVARQQQQQPCYLPPLGHAKTPPLRTVLQAFGKAAHSHDAKLEITKLHEVKMSFANQLISFVAWKHKLAHNPGLECHSKICQSRDEGRLAMESFQWILCPEQ